MTPASLRRAIVIAALFVAARGAHAQRGIDGQIFQPSLDTFGLFGVERAETAPPWQFGFQLHANYAAHPLRLAIATGDAAGMAPTVKTLIARQLGLDLGAQLGLTRWLEIVVDVPVSAQTYTAAYGTTASPADPTLARSGFYVAGGYTNSDPPDAAPRDPRLGFKARLFRRGAVALAAEGVITFPLGNHTAFVGETGFTGRPMLIADVTYAGFTFAVNVGAVLRTTTRVYDPYDVAANRPSPRLLMDLGHELSYAAGARYRFVRWASVGAELLGYVPLVGQTRDYTADVIGGFQLSPTRDLTIDVAAGANVFASALRHDDYRVVVGLRWSRGAAPTGLDTDRDGVPDAIDRCPGEPEDHDGFDDDDGCPDPDNDGDGIADGVDRCPNEAEDRDGFEDNDGCPEPDNDGDGVPDTQDKCPNDAEDKDGFADDDGCPDLDNDGDGIADASDRCPNEAEVFNGIDDGDGCPDSGSVPHGPRIDLAEVIAFDAGRALPGAHGEGQIAHLADLLKAHPYVLRVRIEGHTDGVERKSDDGNRELSQQRADAVRGALIRRGVEPERLQAVGYGAERPLERGTTSATRAKNRRVQLITVEK